MANGKFLKSMTGQSEKVRFEQPSSICVQQTINNDNNNSSSRNNNNNIHDIRNNKIPITVK